VLKLYSKTTVGRFLRHGVKFKCISSFTSGAFVTVGLYAGTACRYVFHAAGKFCENQP